MIEDLSLRRTSYRCTSTLILLLLDRVLSRTLLIKLEIQVTLKSGKTLMECGDVPRLILFLDLH